MTHRTQALCLFLAALGLASCADNLPCDVLCTPAQNAAMDPLQVAPVDYDAIFGRPAVGAVTVDPTPAAAPPAHVNKLL